MGGHRFRVMGDPSTRRSLTKKSVKKGVQFHGVEVREYARSLGDNPSAEDGVPLGLGWEYKDVTTERSTITNENSTSTYSPLVVIPIDEYEKQTERRRRAKLMEMCRLREKSMKYILGMNNNKKATKKRSKSSSLGEECEDSNSSEHTLSEEQMRQLSAHWLKIQPLTAREREKIILQHTNCTRADIEENERFLRKTRRQRKSTMASAESGIDEWHSLIEMIKRRIRRYRSGISKEREQELLWEQANSYWMNGGSVAKLPSTPRNSLRSSISSVSHY